MQMSCGLFDLYRSCTLCPRQCRTDRTSGKTGVCGMSSELYAARAALHFWEEPPISGTRGSGAVFFSGCPLKCVFCQNSEISSGCKGYPVTAETLSDIFLRLQDIDGANNINLITAEHWLPHVIPALENAKSRGLEIPVVYNSSGYESVRSLKMLDGLVDIYLPDMKYISASLSSKYSGAPDYFDVASLAIDEMLRQVGEPKFADGNGKTEDGMMLRGVIVRHLILPTHTDDSCAVIDRLFRRYGHSIYISIMNQYTPIAGADLPPELLRGVTEEEYDSVVDYAIEIGIENGFIQEGGTVTESFIPLWNGDGII